MIAALGMRSGPKVVNALHHLAIKVAQVLQKVVILRTWLTVVLSVVGAVCGVAALLFRK